MRVHFFFLDKLTKCNLLDANLYLCLKPITMRKHPGNGFLNEIVCSTSGLRGQIVELSLLILRNELPYLSVAFTGSRVTEG